MCGFTDACAKEQGFGAKGTGRVRAAGSCPCDGADKDGEESLETDPEGH